MNDDLKGLTEVNAEYSAASKAHREGRFAEAEAGYRRALAREPGHPEAWYDLARLIAASGRIHEAINAYETAIRINPRHRNALINLGYHLGRSQPQRSLELTRRAIAVDPNFHVAHDNLGIQLRALNRYTEAIDSFHDALRVNPAYFRAQLNLGVTLSIVGRVGEAEQALRQAIAQEPRNGHPYFLLGTMIKIKFDDPIVEPMLALYNSASTSETDRMYVAFALGRICDDAGRYDEAFDYWQTGNRLKRKAINYNLKEDEARIAAIKAQFTPEYLQSVPNSGIADETPIFVVGMIRSGTTLMEQILASHPQVQGADENLWFPDAVGRRRDYGPEDLKSIGDTYLARVRGAFGAAPRFVVDKLVANWLYIGEIHMALPNARIICMRRNPLDSCLSAYSCLFAEYHHYCYDMEELAGFYRLFDELMAYWNEVLPGKIYVQSYEALLQDPESGVRGVLDYCDLPFDQRCLEFDKSSRPVRTASYQQVRSKLYTSSVGRWKNYEKYLSAWKGLQQS
ncbi:MAG: sulfotransferase [Hyphomicrobiales bacterium]